MNMSNLLALLWGGDSVQKLQQVTLTVDAASVSFQNVSPNFTYYALIINAESANNGPNWDDVEMVINNDPSAVYQWAQYMYAGTTLIASQQLAGSSTVIGRVNQSGNSDQVDKAGFVQAIIKQTNGTFYIAFEGSSTFFIDSAAVQGLHTFGGSYDSPGRAKLTRIDLTLASASNFLAGSEFTLYGVA